MKNKFQLVQLFPISVPIIRVDENTDELKSYDGAFDNISNASSSQSVDLRILEKYPKTKKILLDYFRKFSNEVLGYGSDYGITTSWLTRTREGQSSTFHNHKNSFWSGVYYYDHYDDNVAEIQFTNPLAIYNQYELNVVNPTLSLIHI